jgi:hypothetical protein
VKLCPAWHAGAPLSAHLELTIRKWTVIFPDPSASSWLQAEREPECAALEAVGIMPPSASRLQSGGRNYLANELAASSLLPNGRYH